MGCGSRGPLSTSCLVLHPLDVDPMPSSSLGMSTMQTRLKREASIEKDQLIGWALPSSPNSSTMSPLFKAPDLGTGGTCSWLPWSDALSSLPLSTMSSATTIAGFPAMECQFVRLPNHVMHQLPSTSLLNVVHE
ncbi:hypothetical protein Taro_017067 [Colocasia esculenta]|uniref:Uncharacterized protein n=1 Tax=Colocasia esculenta TaxID=4460 RepID=A0A843UQG0_COLES|nr:hypothetical protein [Colocasia esculenta]